jgi:hypothetical protein
MVIFANALVETFASSLDFRDKLANQLELKVRDLQSTDESGQPVPLDLQFLSGHSKELVGRSLTLTLDKSEGFDRRLM